jgi:transcriptional regulator with PAS, ATPase and Fis domain
MGTTRALFGALPRLAAEVCQGEGGLLARLDGLELAVVSSDGGGPGLSLASVRAAVRRTISSGETERVHVPAPPGEPLEIMVVPVAAPPERWALVVALRDPAAASAGVTLEVLTTMVGACVDRISAAERQGHAAPAADGDGAPSRPPSRWAARMTFADLIGEDPAFVDCVELARRAAQSELPLLVTGETGTGKEMLAQAIHNSSSRRREPFVGINVAAIPLELLESELFGYERGAFTSARSGGKPGLFEVAEGGTLLLDEIGDMPLDLQVKLLRVLETGTFMRVGSTQVQETDVRIVAATNRSPGDAVAKGKLREDLLYRLNVFPIHLPPLRERVDDIPLIARHFLEQISEREGAVKRLGNDVLERFAAYRWPGNVRELRNVVYRAYVMTPGPTIYDDCLPTTPGSVSAPGAAPTFTVRVGSTLAEVERQLTLATLEHLGRHKEKTAATLGISLKTLYNRLKEYAAEDGEALSEPGALDEVR